MIHRFIKVLDLMQAQASICNIQNGKWNQK